MRPYPPRSAEVTRAVSPRRYATLLCCPSSHPRRTRNALCRRRSGLADRLRRSPARCRPFSIVSRGGATREAHRRAYAEPFAQRTGTKIVEGGWSSEIARLETAARTRPPRRDVVQVDAATVRSACDNGLLEPIGDRFADLAPRLVPGALRVCGVGSSVGGTVLAFRSDRFAGERPSRLGDFWVVRRFPGPRGSRESPGFTLAWALLADGVPEEELYSVLASEAGRERAFRELDEIRPLVAV